MMSTVRMDEATKERLRRLQLAWHQARGEHTTQKELVARALEYLERHEDDFLTESAWRPLSDSELEHLQRELVGDLGPGTEHLARSVDELLYGVPR